MEHWCSMAADRIPARSSWNAWVQAASARSVTPPDDEVAAAPESEHDADTDRGRDRDPGREAAPPRRDGVDDLEAKLEWPSTEPPAAVMRRSEPTTTPANAEAEPPAATAPGVLPGLVARVGAVERAVASVAERLDSATEAATTASLDVADRVDRLAEALERFGRTLAADVVASNERLTSRVADRVVASLVDRLDRASDAASISARDVAERVDGLTRAVDQVGQTLASETLTSNDQLTARVDQLLVDTATILEQLTMMRRRLPVRSKTDERAQLLEGIGKDVQAAVAAEFERLGHQIADRTVAGLLHTFDVEVVASASPEEPAEEAAEQPRPDRAKRRRR